MTASHRASALILLQGLQPGGNRNETAAEIRWEISAMAVISQNLCCKLHDCHLYSRII